MFLYRCSLIKTKCLYGERFQLPPLDLGWSEGRWYHSDTHTRGGRQPCRLVPCHPSRLAPEEFRAITQQVGLPVEVLTVGVMTVGAMIVGVLTVGVMTVGAMTVGVLTVGTM